MGQCKELLELIPGACGGIHSFSVVTVAAAQSLFLLLDGSYDFFTPWPPEYPGFVGLLVSIFCILSFSLPLIL